MYFFAFFKDCIEFFKVSLLENILNVLVNHLVEFLRLSLELAKFVVEFLEVPFSKFGVEHHLLVPVLSSLHCALYHFVLEHGGPCCFLSQCSVSNIDARFLESHLKLLVESLTHFLLCG